MPIEVTMPALSPTMTEGTLAKWLKKEGDNVAAGDVIAEIETDKATMEVEAVDEGVIGKILVSEGTDAVRVNACIAILLEEGESPDLLKDYKPQSEHSDVTNQPTDNSKSDPAASAKIDHESKIGATPTVAIDQPSLESQKPSSLVADPQVTPVIYATGSQDLDGKRVKASPLAKRLAKEHGIALTLLKGTGPKGRIIKADIESYLMTGGGANVIQRQQQEFDTLPNSNMRKTIAKRLLESKQTVPHFYLTIDCDLHALLTTRSDLNQEADKDRNGKPSYKISVNDFIIKAVALALKKVPDANTSWTEQAILRYRNVDVSVAVAIDGGLITPIVKNADQKTLFAISNEMKSLVSRAREGSLKPEEYQGGGFSISNLGMYQIKSFNAIINPPQSCILAVGVGEERVIIKKGKIISTQMMTVTLSCDHRVVDGAVGAEFLGSFKRMIEHPSLLLI